MSEQKEQVAKYKAEAEEQLKKAGETSIDDAMLTERCNALRVLMKNRDAEKPRGVLLPLRQTPRIIKDA